MKKLLFFIFILGTLTYAQSQSDKVLAQIGKKVIYESEFIERYELTPTFSKQVARNSIASKLQFLYTMCAEKLWAETALDKNYLTHPEVNLAIHSIEKAYVRDALYKQEILDKISITEKEKIDGLIKNASTLYLNFIFTQKKDAINKLYNLLQQGVPFDSILFVRPEKEEQLTPIEISFGNMEKDVENIVYGLSIGEYTKPIITRDGWYIFKLSDKRERIFDSSQEKQEANDYVEKIIKKRKEAIVLQQFMAKFFKGIKVDTDARLFELLAMEMQNRFNIKLKQTNKTAPNDLLHIDATDILALENKIGSKKLLSVFIKLPGKNVTLGHFIREMAYDGFNSEIQYAHKIRAKLDARVKKYIEFELLADEGFKRGLQYLPDVKNSIAMWKDNYLQQALKANFFESEKVTDEEAFELYKKKYKEITTPMQVNIIEILVKDSSQVSKIQKEIFAGKDFYSLAERYSERESTKKSKGEFGFFPISMHGKIGEIASKMKINEIYGPLKIEEGYSFFKLIGKKDSSIAPPSKSFEEAKQSLKIEIAKSKMEKEYISKTVEYAKQKGISINLNNLNEVEVTQLNSFAIRHMGFGGKITAVPLLAPFTEWVEFYKQINPELP